MAAGETVLAAAHAAGVELVAVCGGVGVCRTCRVQHVRGSLSAPTLTEEGELDPEELAAGWRLACQAEAWSDVTLDVPPQSLATTQRLQLEGEDLADGLAPPVVALDVALAPPGNEDLRADATRIAEAVQTQGYPAPVFGLSVLQDASGRLRQQDWAARLAVRRAQGVDELVAVLAPHERLLGLAVDVGTTKLAAYLVDLESGQTLARTGTMNPQIAYGEDVVSRIAYANQHTDRWQLLHDRLIGTLNERVAVLCAEAGTRCDQVVEAVVVGNTAMHHLFAGLPVRQLGEAPYVPVVSEALSVPAREVGLQLAPGAYVYLPPNVAGYVGADHVAMLLATQALRRDGLVVALDIGTNTEISLVADGRLLTCSCASGPAFEGAHIRDGMRAVPGAIERVQVANGAFHVHTVGGQRPVGICGSGILDAVATLRAAGVIDGRGRLDETHPRVRRRTGQVEFVLVPAADTGHGQDLVVTRKDIHEVQLAKAAIRAGVYILLGEAGIAPAAVDTFIVAGAFGTYLNLASAVQIGMFPALPRARFEQVGNAAGMGALQMLRSTACRQDAEALLQRVEYIELTTHTGFTEAFMDALFL